MSDNLYYDKHETIKKILEFEMRDPDWSFDIYLLVYDTDSKAFYSATDSGCSCPTPFEDHTFPTDYVGPLNEKQAIADMSKAFNESSYSDKGDKAALIAKILKAGATND